MKTILITGGSGFFGWNAFQYFTRKGFNVIPCSNRPEFYEHYLGVSPFVELDILNQQRLIEIIIETDPDFILHAAALSNPQVCQQHPVRANEINIIGTSMVFGAAGAMSVPIVFLSTDLVFDGERGNYTETDLLSPTTEYGHTKFQAELMLQEQNFFNKWVILRSSLMFGNGTHWTHGFPQFALEALKQGKQTTLFYDQFRTPVFTNDVACAALMTVEQQKFGEIFHVGGDERLSRVDFVRRYCKEAGISFDGIVEKSMFDVPDYLTKVRDVSLISTKLQNATGWRATPLEESFRLMLENESL